MWFFLRKVARQAQIGYSNVTMFVKQNICWFQIPIHYVTLVHVF